MKIPIDNKEIEEIRCTKCGELVCKKYKNADTKGILFWCRRCKENFEIEEKK